MIKSIMAGLMIAFAATLNLEIGGIAGSIVFSLGLLTILFNGYHLFTGKAGLLATKQIHPMELTSIWIGNLCGSIIFALLVSATDLAEPIRTGAAAINTIRLENLPFTNVVMGIICGILMSLAVFFYNYNRIYLTIMCVAAFILFGANHCVADMFYFAMGNNFAVIWPLLFTTLGNIIGCNIVGLANSYIKNKKTT